MNKSTWSQVGSIYLYLLTYLFIYVLFIYYDD